MVGGCTWSWGVYLVPGGCNWPRVGGAPGHGGCTWSLCTWSGGNAPGPGEYLPRGVYLVLGRGVPGPRGVNLVPGVYLVPGGVPAQVLPPVDRQTDVKT